MDPLRARPLRRALQKHVESPLSISLLSGEFKSGDTVIVDVDEETKQLAFRPLGEPIPAENIQTVDSQSSCSISSLTTQDAPCGLVKGRLVIPG